MKNMISIKKCSFCGHIIFWIQEMPLKPEGYSHYICSSCTEVEEGSLMILPAIPQGN